MFRCSRSRTCAITPTLTLNNTVFSPDSGTMSVTMAKPVVAVRIHSEHRDRVIKYLLAQVQGPFGRIGNMTTHMQSQPRCPLSIPQLAAPSASPHCFHTNTQQLFGQTFFIRSANALSQTKTHTHRHSRRSLPHVVGQLTHCPSTYSLSHDMALLCRTCAGGSVASETRNASARGGHTLLLGL